MKTRLIRGIILTIISLLALIIPLGILIINKRDVWFAHGVDKLGLGFIIALIAAILLLKGAFKNLDKRIVSLGTLAVLLILVWCFDSILDDLFWVLICCIIGYGCYLVIDIFARKDLLYVKEYKSERARMDARYDAKKEAEEAKKKEQEQPKESENNEPVNNGW